MLPAQKEVSEGNKLERGNGSTKISAVSEITEHPRESVMVQKYDPAEFTIREDAVSPLFQLYEKFPVKFRLRLVDFPEQIVWLLRLVKLIRLILMVS